MVALTEGHGIEEGAGLDMRGVRSGFGRRFFAI
jgi:hypothetical protein